MINPPPQAKVRPYAEPVRDDRHNKECAAFYNALNEEDNVKKNRSYKRKSKKK